jgi:mRNA-degrading endonuclease RelE of RelBE toxin-antitoxin system
VNISDWINSSTKWNLVVTKPAARSLSKFPAKDRAKIEIALVEMLENPFAGDITRLKGQPAAWRRRVGSYRILYDILPEQSLVVVIGIVRRTSTTY